MNRLHSIVFAAALLAAGEASAGEAGDRLGRCLVDAAKPADRTALVRWMVSALAVHPDLDGLVVIDTAQRDAAERAAATTFERLVAVDCAHAARGAIAVEGADSFGAAFQTLGELAMTEVVEQRDVQAGVGGLLRHVDMLKLGKALASP
ncbi:hypothetical protein [Lysobacter humi (ex Lee et al. 2017)]